MSELDGYAEFVRERGKLMDEIERLRGLLREARDYVIDAQELSAHCSYKTSADSCVERIDAFLRPADSAQGTSGEPLSVPEWVGTKGLTDSAPGENP